jgi:hypothetical protein
MAVARIVNQKLIEEALLNAFDKWAEDYVNDIHWEEQFDDMTKWDWEEQLDDMTKWDRESKTGKTDGKTLRKNKELVGSPRDIYDLGYLYKSGVKSFKLNRTSNGTEANWHWDATNSSGEEYAWYVHEGTDTMKGRPFTDDISMPSSFFRKGPGKALLRQVQDALSLLK